MDAEPYREKIEQGERLFQSGRIEEALHVFDSVVREDPGNTMALNDRGVVLNALKRYDEAVAVFSEVLDHDRFNSNAVFNLISNYLSLGEWKRAEEVLERFGGVLPAHDAAMIRSDLERINHPERTPGEAASAKVPDPCDDRAWQERIRAVIEKPIFFIVGCPKSGTTWVQNILDGHPDVFCPGESNVNLLMRHLFQMAEAYNRDIDDINRKYIGRSNGCYFLSGETIAYLFRTLLGLLFSSRDEALRAACLGTKNPDHMKHMEVSARLLPTARYIHIIRDGRDVAVFGMFHNLRVNPEGFRKMFPTLAAYAGNIGASWAADISAARAFGRACPDRYLEIRYEDLHRDPDPVIRRMLEFTGVDASKDSVGLCRENGSFERLTGGRKRGKEERSSFFRKGAVGDWKNHFDPRCVDAFMRNGGDMLRELGYR